MQSGSLLALLVSLASIAGAIGFIAYEKKLLAFQQPPAATLATDNAAQAGPSAPVTGLEEGTEMEVLQRRVQRLEEQNQLLEADNKQLRQDLSDERIGKLPPPEAPAILADIEKARSLKFQTAPSFQSMPFQQLQDKVKAAAVSAITPESAAARVRGYQAMGFLDQVDDLKATLGDLAAYQMNYFYDPATQQVFVQDDAALGTKIGRDRYAMAASRVLLSQNFPDVPMNWADSSNDDRLRASRALLAGDVNYTRLQFSLSDAYPEKDLPSPTEPIPPYAPLVFMEEMKFVNDAGANFVSLLWQNGGPTKLAETYKAPPTSTAQILHPEELFLSKNPWQPAQIDWHDVKINDQEPLFSNVAGELGILLLLNDRTESDRAIRAAQGWLGDRYLVYPGSPEHGDHVFWKTTWQTEADAREFLEEIQRHMMDRYSIPWQKKQVTATTYTINDPNRVIRIQIGPDNKSVTVINVTDASFADALEKKFVL